MAGKPFDLEEEEGHFWQVEEVFLKVFVWANLDRREVEEVNLDLLR